MSGTTLLLSDLHLPVTASPLRLKFAAFLQGPARAADAVYLLGDLFESWIGDDIGVLDYADEIRALRATSDAGVQLCFMHGNRDFLVGARFAAATGVALLPDPTHLMLAGVPTLLSHGDVYCTADHAYQRWRRFSRHRGVQHAFLKLPARLRRRIGGAARGQSDRDKRHKPEIIMDVENDAVKTAFRHSQAVRIIHGHTHRPAQHHLAIDGRDVERLVLADWTPERCEYLRVTESRFERIRL